MMRDRSANRRCILLSFVRIVSTRFLYGVRTNSSFSVLSQVRRLHGCKCRHSFSDVPVAGKAALVTRRDTRKNANISRPSKPQDSAHCQREQEVNYFGNFGTLRADFGMLCPFRSHIETRLAGRHSEE
jgi:hypothetical protein